MVGKQPAERPASMAEIEAELAQVSAELGGAPLLSGDSQAALAAAAAGPPRPVAATGDPVLSLTADFSTTGMGPPPGAASPMGTAAAQASLGASPAAPAAAADRGRRRPVLWIGGALLAVGAVGLGALSLLPRGRQPPPSARGPAGRDAPASPPRRAAPAPRLIEHGPGRMLLGRPGSGVHADGPPYAVEVGRFALEAYEVSVAQLAEYAEATNNRGLLATADLATGGDRPAVGLTRAQALAYCSWRHPGGRLPTEIEWEYAARDGRNDRQYPFAASDAASLGLRANVDNPRGQLDPVDSHPTGVSAHGVYNLIGNAAEWTLSDSAAYPGSRASVPRGLAVVRGGSAATPAHGLTATSREFVAAGRSDPFIGFRCATGL
jgi:formylglycine-generating enzyme required for sulfatase activity